MTELLAHSPLGASGAHRWMVCPGSVTLSQGISDTESEHAALGTAAHALSAECLTENQDAWAYIGTRHGNDIECDKEMADAVQIYLDAVRAAHPDRDQGNSYIERPFHCPTIHEQFYGTADFVFYDTAKRELHVWDYKHGAGIVVEVQDNPQLLYYAAGALEDLGLWNSVDYVVLRVAQPRGFHSAGPIREWSVSTEKLIAWLEDILVPAMNRAMTSNDLVSGEHCRFCPARTRACPALAADMDELEATMTQIANLPKGAAELTTAQIGRFLDLCAQAKIVGKAAEQEAFARLNGGHAVPGWKLAAAKANRIWRDEKEATARLKKKFKDRAFTEPKLKSPAQIEELPEGKALVAELAHKPDAGLTVVRATDSRAAVSKETKSLFTDTTKKGKSNG